MGRAAGSAGGRRSSSAGLLVGKRLERSEAVARPMPEEPLVIRMVLFLREVRAEELTVKVVILGFCVRLCVCYVTCVAL